MTYLLDTNALSEPARRRPSLVFMERLRRQHSELSTSVLCAGEMLYGARRRPGLARYENYLRAAVVGNMPILDVDFDVVTRYADLRAETEREGRARADMDLLIAATALRHGLTLVTRNVRHFADLPGLSVEDWTTS